MQSLSEKCNSNNLKNLTFHAQFPPQVYRYQVYFLCSFNLLKKRWTDHFTAFQSHLSNARKIWMHIFVAVTDAPADRPKCIQQRILIKFFFLLLLLWNSHCNAIANIEPDISSTVYYGFHSHSHPFFYGWKIFSLVFFVQ